jgi:uncharacterized membrane protein YdjX (TVP38/TMEM64 family)
MNDAKPVPRSSEGNVSPRRPYRNAVAAQFVIAVIIIAVLALASLPFLSFFGDPERISRFIDGAGPWGPLVYILIQAGQVFAAPIPGQVTGFVAGFLFGPVLGTVYAAIGGTIGCALVFFLSRRLGRPFVERFVSARLMERFDYLTESGGALILLLIFLVPIFPDDLISYIAGLTRIPLYRLILVALFGRLPGYVLFALAGSGAAAANMTLLIVIAVGTLVLLGAAFWQRHRIEAFIRRLSERKRGRSAAG